MNSVMRLVTAFAAGAAIMYYFDPETGRRRRAMAREQGVGAGHDIEDFARNRSKRAADHVQGAVARTRTRLDDTPVDDRRLRERIRSRIGHLVDDPGAVSVQVRDGHVLLGGNASPEEIEAVVEAVTAVPGVEEVDNRLASGRPDASSGAAGEEARH
jgi:hypothetical protein